MLDLKAALNILESGEWVHLRYISANVAKGSGGRIIEFQKCRITRSSRQQITEDAPRRSESAPAHHHNFTRNVELPSKEIRKVHPILITHINNRRVV